MQIYKGFYNESNLEYNYLTKLYSQSYKLSGLDDTKKDEEFEDHCNDKIYINSLVVNQVYILFGNFNEGRLFLRRCDYLKRLDLMRSKDLSLLRNGINCG